MTRLIVLLSFLPPAFASEGLHGTVTDPSGAGVPGAVVQLRGKQGVRRIRTDHTGHYFFPAVSPGRYELRIAAKGFSVLEKKDVRVSGDAVLDAQLAIEAKKQVVNVEDESAGLSANPASNLSALVLRRRQLAALSDDPD